MTCSAVTYPLLIEQFTSKRNELLWANSALRDLSGDSVSIFNIPFLNRIDKDWLREILVNVDVLLVLDDHYLDGGVGQMVGTALAEIGCPIRLIRRGIDEIPQYGFPDEVLMSHELHRVNLAVLLKKIIN